LDSLTQAVLGATVGELVLGKKVGNKAPLWGAIAGTIPDLDVLLNFFVGDVQSTLWHRTFSHSFIFLTLAAPLLGYLVYFLHRNSTSANPIDWFWLFFWGLITHPLLDSCTNYGTMLFYPFSDFRVAFRTIYIIDPLYTLPLLIATIAVLFMRRNSRTRKNTARLAIILSTAYLLLTSANKLYVNHVVKHSLEEQQISHEKFMSSPTFFNNLLWSVIVKSGSDYYVGYYSILDNKKQIDFNKISQQKGILLPYLQKAKAEDRQLILELLEFTEYFYLLEPVGDGLNLYDLRFGKLSGWFDDAQNYIFTFSINSQEEELRIERVDAKLELQREDFLRLLKRTQGN